MQGAVEVEIWQEDYSKKYEIKGIVQYLICGFLLSIHGQLRHFREE